MSPETLALWLVGGYVVASSVGILAGLWLLRRKDRTADADYVADGIAELERHANHGRVR